MLLSIRADIEGVHTRVEIKLCASCDCEELWVNGVYGNPPVTFHPDHPPPVAAIDLGNDYMHVLTDSYPYSDYQNNLLELTSIVSGEGCTDIVPGAPEFGYYGFTTNGQGEVEYWIHSTSFLLQSNTLEQPLDDGGRSVVNMTASAPYSRQRAVCSNVPRTFLNEDHCVLSNDACFIQEGGDASLEINEENLRKIYVASGNGTAETKYGKHDSFLRRQVSFCPW